MSPQEAKDRNRTTSELGVPEKTQPAVAVQSQESVAPEAIHKETERQEPRVTTVPAEVKTPQLKPEYSEEASSKLKDILHTLFNFDFGDTTSTTPENFLISVQNQLGAAGVTPKVDPEAYIRGILNNRDKLKKAIKEGVVDAQEASEYIATLNAEAITVRRDHEDTLNKNFLEELDKEGLRFGAGAGAETPPPPGERVPMTDDELRRLAAINAELERGRGRGEYVDPKIEAFVEDEGFNPDNAEQMEQLAKLIYEETTLRGGNIDRRHKSKFLQSQFLKMSFIEQLLYVYDVLPTTPSERFSDIIRQIIPSQFLEIIDNPDPNMSKEAAADKQYYARYIEIRKGAHDLAIYAERSEAKDLANALEHFGASNFELAYTTITAVGSAKRLYEQSWEKLRAKYGGVLPPEVIEWDPTTRRSEVDDLAYDLLKEMSETVGLTRLDPTGRAFENQKLTELELRKALNLARSLNLIDLRTHEHIAKSKMPTIATKSFYAEKITRSLDLIRRLIERFQIGQDQANKTIAIISYPLDYAKQWFFSKDVIIKSVWGIHPKEFGKRLRDIMNLTGAGAWFTGSAWRMFSLLENPEKDPEKRRQRQVVVDNAGYTMRLAALKEDAAKHAKEQLLQPAGSDQFKREVLWEQEYYSDRYKELREKYTYEGFDTIPGVIELLKQLSKRSPLRIVRMLEDVELMKHQDVYREIFVSTGLMSADYWDGLPETDRENFIDSLERDLILLTEERMLRDIRSDDLHYEILRNPRRERRARYAVNFIRSLVDETHQLHREPAHETPEERRVREERLARTRRFVHELGMKEWEFAPVYEDIPWEKLRIITTGERSPARKVHDFVGHEAAMTGLADLIGGKLVKMKNMDEILDYVAEHIHGNIIKYNNEVANKFTYHILRGIAYFFRKDWKAEPPFIPVVGSIYSFFARRVSVAEYAYGPGHMSWDSRTLHHLAHGAWNRGLLSRAQEHKLSKQIGATNWNRASWWTRGTIVALLFSILSKTKEEASKEIKV